jgi:histone acetyltransferase 1
VEKLEGAVDNQQEEYEERLEGLATRAAYAQDSSARTKPKRKRAIIDEDDEDDDGWEDMDDASVSSKRMRA